MSIPYLPLFVTDYEADTAHLSIAEDGAYMRLLRLQWRTPGCTLPDDPAWIQRRCRASDDEWKTLFAPILSEYFKRRNGRILQARLMREWERINVTSKKRSDAGRKGGRPAKALKKKETDESPVKANEKHLELELELDSNSDTSYRAETADPPKQEIRDPSQVIFTDCLAVLTAAGVNAKHARSVLGRWRKVHGDAAVIAATGQAKREGAIDPVAFITGCLKFQRSQGAPPGEGFLDRMRRQYGAA